MGTPADRRTVGTLVVDRPAQYRLLLPFGLFWFAFVGFILLMYKQDQDALEAVRRETTSAEGLSALAKFSQAQGPILTTALLGSLILGIMCFAFWLVYSNRIFGPMIPIRRHVTELLNGNYDGKIVLRDRDELLQLAADLNQLAVKLKEKPTES